MHCSKCGSTELRVVDSRPSEAGNAIRRRRECERCHFRFTTYERREEQPLIVIKQDGRREPFDRQKVMRGLVAATVKRGIDMEDLYKLIDSLEDELRDDNQVEVTSTEIGEKVLNRLVELDGVAAVRFASVYRRFNTPDEFQDELKRLLHDKY